MQKKAIREMEFCFIQIQLVKKFFSNSFLWRRYWPPYTGWHIKSVVMLRFLYRKTKNMQKHVKYFLNGDKLWTGYQLNYIKPIAEADTSIKIFNGRRSWGMPLFYFHFLGYIFMSELFSSFYRYSFNYFYKDTP